MVVHSVILLPGNNLTYYCKDGLSPLDVQNIEHLLNFGGNIKAVDCGAGNEYVTLMQAMGDMMNMYFDAAQRKNETQQADFDAARIENQKSFAKFQQSDVYKKWVAGKDSNQINEMLFQANA